MLIEHKRCKRCGYVTYLAGFELCGECRAEAAIEDRDADETGADRCPPRS